MIKVKNFKKSMIKLLQTNKILKINNKIPIITKMNQIHHQNLNKIGNKGTDFQLIFRKNKLRFKIN